jgi:hypothetical protein
MLSVCVASHTNFLMAKQIFTKVRIAWNLSLISSSYLMNPSHQSVCLFVYALPVARQLLGKNPPMIP